MNEPASKGLLGAAITATGTLVTWLPAVNLLVQILAGITAIIAGIFTIRYYHKKTKKL